IAIDRRGNGAAANLAEGTLLWEERLSDGGLFSDPVAEGQAVYFTAGDQLHGVDPGTGEPLFAPLDSITTPPLIEDGAIYVGRSRELLEVDPSSGAVRRALELPVELSGRPGSIGERIVVGSLEGSFFVINRTGWFSATRPTGD
ncbi:MAG: PQQ-binding-like beta-propeller repeat protein, partial [Alkalispirochaetaceae bacterium]